MSALFDELAVVSEQPQLTQLTLIRLKCMIELDTVNTIFIYVLGGYGE